MNRLARNKTGSPAAGDLPVLLEDLDAGAWVSLLVAPAARAVLPDLPRILGFFRRRGVRAFFPVLPYADITAWVYYRLLRADPEAVLVSSACAGISRLAGRKFPAPKVYSPLLCAARYLKTYRGISGAFAFLSPCAQKSFEFRVQRKTAARNPVGITAGTTDGTSREEEELVRYNITVAALGEWLSAARFDQSAYPPVADNGGEFARKDGADIDFSRGLTAARFGNLSDALAALFPELHRVIARGIEAAGKFPRDTGVPGRPFFFEPYACPGGCAGGSGIPDALRLKSGGEEVSDNTGPVPPDRDALRAALLERFSRFDAILDMEDFCHN